LGRKREEGTKKIIGENMQRRKREIN